MNRLRACLLSSALLSASSAQALGLLDAALVGDLAVGLGVRDGDVARLRVLRAEHGCFISTREGET